MILICLLTTVNINKRTITLYKMSTILKHLNIVSKEFKLLCLLSKNDYNIEGKYTIYDMFNLFYKFKESKYRNLYKWIKINTEINYLPDQIYNNRCKIPIIINKNKILNKDLLIKYLHEFRFIFI